MGSIRRACKNARPLKQPDLPSVLEIRLAASRRGRDANSFAMRDAAPCCALLCCKAPRKKLCDPERIPSGGTKVTKAKRRKQRVSQKERERSGMFFVAAELVQ